MYVSRLDRPWIETPFLLQGFQIKQAHDIEQVARHCRHVFIDIERGDGLGPPPAPKVERAQPTWGDETHSDLELPVAKTYVARLSDSVADVYQQARTSGPIDIGNLKRTVADVVDSAIRSADASILLARLRRKDDYTYNHVLAVSVLAVGLGKQLSFSKDELRVLALAGSLFDVGKVKIPDGLLAKTGPLSSAERKVLRRHVDFGVKVLEQIGADPIVIEVAQDHHERVNGAGYPNGKLGPSISLYAQIVGLIDTYDAMVSKRVYRAAMSHEAAIRELYELRGNVFQADLLEQFIQCLGIYPAGTLVELTTGEVAVVMQQNRVRRLRPRVMLVLGADKKPLDTFPIVDLLTEERDGNGRPLAIAVSLAPGAYGIDPAEYFL